MFFFDTTWGSRLLIKSSVVKLAPIIAGSRKMVPLSSASMQRDTYSSRVLPVMKGMWANLPSCKSWYGGALTRSPSTLGAQKNLRVRRFQLPNVRERVCGGRPLNGLRHAEERRGRHVLEAPEGVGAVAPRCS